MVDSPVNPGLASFWDGLIFLNRLTGGKPRSPKEEADRRGWSGAVNVEITGPGGGAWHFLLGDLLVRIGRGALPDPRAVIRMDAETMFRMIAGQSTMFSLTLTGAVTASGEGLATMLLWSTISGLRALAAGRGPLPWAIAWWLRRVLARSGTGMTLEVGTP